MINRINTWVLSAVLALAPLPGLAQTIGAVPTPAPFNVSGYGVGAWQVTNVAPGTGYVPGDTYTPTVPSATASSILGGNYSAAALVITSTQVVAAAPSASGTGCTNGTYTVTGTTGTGGAGIWFTANVTVTSNVPVVNSLTTGGTYQVNPTNLASEPVSGVTGCSGGNAPTLALTMGALYAVVTNPGNYSAIASNPSLATQGATSGAGTGATFNITFAPQGLVLPPSNSNVPINGGAQALLSQCQGYLTCAAVTTGIELTAFGWKTLGLNTTGSLNAGFGVHALAANTTGQKNTGLGNDTVGNNQTGNNNTCIGSAACQGVINDSFTSNTAVGSGALTAITTANNNTCLGFQCLVRVTSGNSNVAVGNAAGFTITTGFQNIILGACVGSTGTLTTGARNILIGVATNCDTPASGTNDTIVIAASTLTVPWMTGSLVAASMTMTMNAPTINMPNLANAATTSAVCFNTGSGLLTFDGTIGTCNTSSMRFKHDLLPLEDTQPHPLEAVLRMQPKSFFYNDDQRTPGQQLGLMAEELAAIDPRLVSYDESGQPNAIRFLGPMAAYMIGAIHELQGEIDALRARH